MTQYTEISLTEMHDHLDSLGFSEIPAFDATEKVYGKVVATNICLRIYTSVAHGQSRPVGQDAIRLVLVTRLPDGQVRPIGKSQKVLRIETWRQNLEKKINTWNEYFGPPCPKCNNHTVSRSSKHGEFWGCVQYPACKGTLKGGAW